MLQAGIATWTPAKAAVSMFDHVNIPHRTCLRHDDGDDPEHACRGAVVELPDPWSSKDCGWAPKSQRSNAEDR
jgi:hypothetical protein